MSSGASKPTNVFNARFERILPLVRRPGRYVGGEWNQVVKGAAEVSVALAYPDVYEVGMSNLGLQILYEIVNDHPKYRAERVFAPWTDMETQARSNEVPLLTLESRRPVSEFDIFGFSLQYELTFTNVLNMLDLAGIPLRAELRGEGSPVIIAGGPCVFNPEPMADFIDAFVVGEGEEVILELLGVIAAVKTGQGGPGVRGRLIEALSKIEGVYVPGAVKWEGRYPLRAPDGSALTVKRRLVSEFDRVPVPKSPVVPAVEAIHDRCVVEIMRGCTRGCRFCQAGIVYRPARERSAATVAAAAARQIENTGYDEISFSSLSATDHSEILEILKQTRSAVGDFRPVLSLPSMRTDKFSVEIAEQIAKAKKTGLTFAPEAGTARLRQVINKGLDEEAVLGTAVKAFTAGWRRIKLYFMIGLPTETDEDVLAIAKMAEDVLARAREALGIKAARQLKVVVSVSSFIPKAQSAFQWAQALSLAEVQRRQNLLKERLTSRQIDFKWHESKASVVESALARGDRRLGRVIEAAFLLGARFDSWSDQFNFDLWQSAFKTAGVNLDLAATSGFEVEADLPWDHIDCGVDKEWLALEYRRALEAVPTDDCRTGPCSLCGVCGPGVRMEIVES